MRVLYAGSPVIARPARAVAIASWIEALIGFACVFALALMRVPLAFAMGLVGFVGLGVLRGWPPSLQIASR